ncbi:RDD family protein [Methyloligella halotolerans]|uniref:RDD family protein n=1 Tax=Methyloligella halotolerans TaxID=1177755 RepID=A0A1E2RUT7_9HYPH|nr:RDD family protein [Methyloligella halotolerans]ODA65983.1 RDD family protein [Methyloligella halotolerans]
MPYCPDCRAYVSSRDRFCSSCGATLTEEAAEDRPSGPAAAVPPAGSSVPTAGASNPDPGYETSSATLRADIPEARAPAGMTYAGLASRGFAQIIDMIIVFVLYWFLGIAIAVQVGGRTPGGFELEGDPALWLFGLWIFGALLYYAVLESSWKGQTVGKMIARIKVASETGARCSFSQALIRNLVRPIDFIFFYGLGAFFILISPMRQRLGDRAAKTIVVQA